MGVERSAISKANGRERGHCFAKPWRVFAVDRTRREGEKIDRTLVKRFTTAMETLKRYGGGSNNSFSSSSFPSAVRNSKKRSAEEEEEEEEEEGTMMMVDDNKKQQLTPKSTPPMLVFNFERLFLENTARFYAKESDKRFGITKKSAAECADYLKHCQTRLNEETLDRAESYLQPQTKLVLTKTVEKALIQDKKLEIIDSSDEMLADSSKVEDLKRLVLVTLSRPGRLETPERPVHETIEICRPEDRSRRSCRLR